MNFRIDKERRPFEIRTAYQWFNKGRSAFNDAQGGLLLDTFVCRVVRLQMGLVSPLPSWDLVRLRSNIMLTGCTSGSDEIGNLCEAGPSQASIEQTFHIGSIIVHNSVSGKSL